MAVETPVSSEHSMPTWKRILLRSAGFGAGFAIVVCAGIGGVIWHQAHRSASEVPAYHEVSVKASDWPLHATKVCFFFGTGSSPIVGCWDDEDVGGHTSNRNEAPQDHLFLVDVTVSEETKKALTEEHNRKLYCVRDDYKRLTCGGNGL